MTVARITLFFLVTSLSLWLGQTMTPDVDSFIRMHYPNLVSTQPANYSRWGNFSACTRALMDLVRNKALLVPYIDASGKPPSGILLGNMAWLGSYDECVLIPGAHYCLTNMFLNVSKFVDEKKVPKLLSHIKLGLCVPKSCGEMDIANDLYRFIHTFRLSKLIDVAPQNAAVICARPSKYTTGVILALTLCGIILLLCLVGTALEVKESFTNYELSCSNVLCLINKADSAQKVVNAEIVDASDKENLLPSVTSKKSIFEEILLCFSLIRNTKQIMNTKVPIGAITSLNGMRVLSMWWVILGHTIFFMSLSGNVSNIKLALGLTQRFSFQAILNATFSVDSFFFLSGLLVSYLSMREMDKRGKLPLLKFYFHRFWRLTPSYMFVILFFDKLVGFFGQGPFWYGMQYHSSCNKYWWTNLLYINNFYPKDLARECVGWTWYLANDMQFYIISPIILYATYKLRVIGLVISTAPLFMAQFITTGILFYHYKLAAVGTNMATANHMENIVYTKPYCRISVYLIGLAVGYLLHKQRGRVQRLPLVVVIAGWFVATALAMLVVYGPYSVYKEGGTPFNMAENIAYGTFSRAAWGLALAWVIYACQNGYGGIVDSILSARFWIPLSRLTYSAYLVHIIVMGVYFASLTVNLAYSDMNYAFAFVASCAISYGVAFILAVCVEFPTMQLEKVLFRSRERDR